MFASRSPVCTSTDCTFDCITSFVTRRLLIVTDLNLVWFFKDDIFVMVLNRCVVSSNRVCNKTKRNKMFRTPEPKHKTKNKPKVNAMFRTPGANNQKQKQQQHNIIRTPEAKNKRTTTQKTKQPKNQSLHQSRPGVLEILFCCLFLMFSLFCLRGSENNVLF